MNIIYKLEKYRTTGRNAKKTVHTNSPIRAIKSVTTTSKSKNKHNHNPTFRHTTSESLTIAINREYRIGNQ